MLEDRIKVGDVEQLDRFHAVELGCDVDSLRCPSVQFLPSDRRSRPGWGGYTVPVFALSTAKGGVVSCRPDMLGPPSRELRHAARDEPLAEADFERLRRMARRVVPFAYSLSGFVLYCDRASFRPFGDLAERLDPADNRGSTLRRRFDGEIFVVRGPRGEIASWSAIKLKSDQVWEIAVVTEAAYRGRGYARQAVSAATRHIIEQGRMALYVHDRTNHASAKVCRALGYVEYAETFFCEY